MGTRIAVLADSNDDISSLEIPAEDKPQQSQPTPEQKKSAPPSSSTPESSKSAAREPSKVGNMPSSVGKPTKQTYPLYPSVSHLLHENGLGVDEADKIPATGPNGRLLKGDVLAYLGRIEKSYSAEQSSRIAKLGHLDLSNIKVAALPAPAKENQATEAATLPPVEEIPVQLDLPISFKAVLDVQARIEKTLGTHLPISTFVARAIELANEDLPLSKTRKPTAEDLFNSVLGLDALNPRASNGSYIPQVTPLALSTKASSKTSVVQRKKLDVFDEILGAKPRTRLASNTASPSKAPGEAVNVFSVLADQGDEKRAMVFLQRVKTVLEAEPGRLII